LFVFNFFLLFPSSQAFIAIATDYAIASNTQQRMNHEPDNSTTENHRKD